MPQKSYSQQFLEDFNDDHLNHSQTPYKGQALAIFFNILLEIERLV